MAAVVVTHELDSAFSIADRMILLKRAVAADGDDWEGAIVYEEGTPEDLRGSRRPYTVDFLGEYSRYDLCANPKCRSVETKGSKTCTACGYLREVHPLDAPAPEAAPPSVAG